MMYKPHGCFGLPCQFFLTIVKILLVEINNNNNNEKHSNVIAYYEK